MSTRAPRRFEGTGVPELIEVPAFEGAQRAPMFAPNASRALGVLETLGRRLVSDERAPYEIAVHDEILHLDDPTDPMLHVSVERQGRKKQ